jgi:hypothetical protein
MRPARVLDKAKAARQLGVPEFSLPSRVAACSGNWNVLPAERGASDVLPTFHANTPDGERFLQYLPGRFPGFAPMRLHGTSKIVEHSLYFTSNACEDWRLLRRAAEGLVGSLLIFASPQRDIPGSLAYWEYRLGDRMS